MVVTSDFQFEGMSSILIEDILFIFVYEFGYKIKFQFYVTYCGIMNRLKNLYLVAELRIAIRSKSEWV